MGIARENLDRPELRFAVGIRGVCSAKSDSEVSYLSKAAGNLHRMRFENFDECIRVCREYLGQSCENSIRSV